MSVKIAAILRTGGEPLLAEHLRTVHRLAQDFTELLRNRPNFEVALTPESNIVCFRHHEPGMQEDALDQHNARLRREIIATGRFYLVQTVLRGRTWLRCALMNPFTQVSHLRELLNELERLAK
jgi:L-2,4-diaminobutyrate decarboxylase